MALEPITRAEQIMSGESLEPITREEMFLAKAAGMDVDTPEPITRREMFLSMIQPGGGSGLPSGSQPNQYLVTDGDGNAKWEDKLAWSGLEFLLDEQTLASEKEGEFQARVAIFSDIKGGEIYTVTWDGVAYPCVCQESAGNFYLGNVAAFGSPDDTGEPFAIRLEWVDEEGGFYGTTILAQSGVSHTVGIATETIHPIDKKYLPSGILYADENRLLFHDSNFTNPVLYEEGKDAGNIIIRHEDSEYERVVDYYPVFKKIVEKVNAVEFHCIGYDDNANPGFKTFCVGVVVG